MDFSFRVFCAGDWVGVTSLGLGGFVTGRFLEVCRVESLQQDQLGIVLLLWECGLDGVKLQEPGRLLPGKVGNWRSDLDLQCRLRPLFRGVVPDSGDSSQDLLTFSSQEALWHL